MSHEDPKGFFRRLVRRSKKKKRDKKWNILDVLHIGPLKKSKKKKEPPASQTRSMSQEPITERPPTPLQSITGSPQMVPSSSSPNEGQTSKTARKVMGTSVQERSVPVPVPTKSPDAEPVAKTAHEPVKAKEMPVAEESKSDDGNSAKEPSAFNDDDEDQMRRMDVIAGEMKHCEKQLATTKEESRELIKRLGQMSKDIDNLDLILAKVESTLVAKCDAQDRALERLEEAQFQEIQNAAERIDNIQDVSKDVNFQVDEMTADTENHLWYLYNPVYAVVDLFLHMSIALILWIVMMFASQAGYQFEENPELMRPTIQMSPVCLDPICPEKAKRPKGNDKHNGRDGNERRS
ncbi:hypothetical protein QR680_010723 [Steinernema hermaphroditum]|uniref:Transmembrane protein n=1 Tax=Steinernema hermaphroditum TaxID=289476 RepID=A0AA39IR45_9BILA|nr:hypothetical protein QR680_010723 [Steinernema hermaphroditum]